MVHLTVADLGRQIEFYQKVLGFQLHWRKDGSAGLGAGRADLLQLSELPGARRYRNTTGLYHFAVLVPDRRELAKVIARLYALHYRNHPTDHVMTKTTYLDDPEGNTIEVYAESPEDGMMGYIDGEFVARWADGRPSNGREPLDVEALLRLLQDEEKPDTPLPLETRIGHVHLFVSNLKRALDFYHGVLGFDHMGMDAAARMTFVSAGGYHHHVGLNTWVGEGAPPAPAGALGMQYFTILLPDEQELQVVAERARQAGVTLTQVEKGIGVQDPFQNGIVLTVAGGSTK
jgi:catechol 2,3-dioxygenase